MRKSALVVTCLLAAAQPASAQTVLRFDDIPNAPTAPLSAVELTNQYQHLGITFSGGAYAFCLNTAANPSCSNTSYGSGPAGTAAAARNTEKVGLLFQGANLPVMNSSVGFTGGFSFFYSNPAGVNAVFEVWSGLDATGSLLASFVAGPTNSGTGSATCFLAAFCPYVAGGVDFAGTAQSVRFTGNRESITYDDITFGSSTPGEPEDPSSVVPEPSTYLLMAAGLAMLVPLSRRRRTRAA